MIAPLPAPMTNSAGASSRATSAPEPCPASTASAIAPAPNAAMPASSSGRPIRVTTRPASGAETALPRA